MDVWPSAPTLPTRIEMVASAARAGPQSPLASTRATSKRRSAMPKAAAFVAVAMNAVTGVGAPS